MVNRTLAIASLLCGLLALGCSGSSFDSCEVVGDCIEKGHSCPGGQELFCNLDDGASGVCDCRASGSGGTGGSGGGGTGGNMGTGGGGGTGGTAAEPCGGDTECTPEAPSHCGTLCQDICGRFENFEAAGCGENNRCFCVCVEGTGVCTDPL
jgi:hypothetical protein